MWIIFAFGSALFAGITAVLAKIGIKNTDSNIATAIRTIIILLFSWLMVLITGSINSIYEIDGKSLIFLILSGLATGASWLCYFKALQLGDVSKVTPIDKSSTILTMLMAFCFLGESLGPSKIAGIIFIGIGTYLMIVRKNLPNQAKKSAGDTLNKTSKTNQSQKSWLVFAILSAVFASLTSILGKIGISDIDSNLGTAIRTIVVLFMAWLVVFTARKQKELKNINSRSLLFICLSGITTGCSWLCYYKALHDGPASIVVPIDKLSIVVSIAFSCFILKEKLTKKAFAGLLLIVAGTLGMIIIK